MMRRRKLLTSGIALSGTGLLPANVAANESNSDQRHGAPNTEYLGQDQDYLYLEFERSGKKKLNIINKETNEVIVKDRASGEIEFVIDSNTINELQTNRVETASHTPWSGEVKYTDEDLDGIEFGSYEIIKRAGRRWETIGHCDRDCNIHRYDAECFELGKEAGAIKTTSCRRTMERS